MREVSVTKALPGSQARIDVPHTAALHSPPEFAEDPHISGNTVRQPSRARMPCWDTPFLVLFLLFWSGTVALAIFSFIHGEPRLLAWPTDYSGRFCGDARSTSGSPNGTTTVDYADRPYLIAPTGVTDPRTVPGLCVSACPSAGQLICPYYAGNASQCAKALYDTVAVQLRCVPSAIATTPSLAQLDFFGGAAAELMVGWKVLAVSVATATAFALLCLTFLVCLDSAVWLVACTTVLILGSLSALAALRALLWKPSEIGAPSGTVPYLAMAFSAGGVAFLSALGTYLAQPSLTAAATMLRHTGGVLRKLPSLYALPAPFLVLSGGLLAFLVAISTRVATASDLQLATTPPVLQSFYPSDPVVRIPTKAVQQLGPVIWVAFLWGVATLCAVEWLVVASAVGSWFFADPMQGRRVSQPIWFGFRGVVFQQLGVACLAGLVLPPLRLLLAPLVLAQRPAVEKTQESVPTVREFALKYFGMWDGHACVGAALRRVSLFTGRRIALDLAEATNRTAHRVDFGMGLVVLLTKVLVTSLGLLVAGGLHHLSYLQLSNPHPFAPFSGFALYAAVAAASFASTSIILAPLDAAAQTLLACFALDGGEFSAGFTPHELSAFLGGGSQCMVAQYMNPAEAPFLNIAPDITSKALPPDYELEAQFSEVEPGPLPHRSAYGAPVLSNYVVDMPPERAETSNPLRIVARTTTPKPPPPSPSLGKKRHSSPKQHGPVPVAATISLGSPKKTPRHRTPKKATDSGISPDNSPGCRVTVSDSPCPLQFEEPLPKTHAAAKAELAVTKTKTYLTYPATQLAPVLAASITPSTIPSAPPPLPRLGGSHNGTTAAARAVKPAIAQPVVRPITEPQLEPQRIAPVLPQSPRRNGRVTMALPDTPGGSPRVPRRLPPPAMSYSVGPLVERGYPMQWTTGGSRN